MSMWITADQIAPTYANGITERRVWVTSGGPRTTQTITAQERICISTFKRGMFSKNFTGKTYHVVFYI
jgi:hypothetical protein